MCESKEQGAPNGAGCQPLGITAKSSAPPSGGKARESREKRFNLQRVATKILAKDAAKKLPQLAKKRADLVAKSGWDVNAKELKKLDKKYISQVHRTTACTWSAISNHVDVCRDKERGTGHYKGLATCGSVWACPVCASKIQERRRQEICSAIEVHEYTGGKVIMVTLTAPHYRHQSLTELRDMQRKALIALRKTGSYRRMLKAQGYKGLIRSLEATVSNVAGWHLHTHELWFVAGDADVDLITRRTQERWEAACIDAGLLKQWNKKQMSGFRKHSVDVKENDVVGEYLAKMDDESKWGLSHEIALSNAKTKAKEAKEDGKKTARFHPFGLLAEIERDGDWANFAEAKFLEWANVMKGSRQIYWSQGLKAEFLIDEKDDETLAAEQTARLEDIANIPRDMWYKALRWKGFRTKVLDLLEDGEHDRMLLYIYDCATNKPENEPDQEVEPDEEVCQLE